MIKPLNGAGVRYAILTQGRTVTEGTSYFWGNVTNSIQDTSKGLLMIHSGGRAGVGTYKAGKDFARGDALCCFSIGCETISGILVWCPIPGKITTLSTLKAVSMGCQN